MFLWIPAFAAMTLINACVPVDQLPPGLVPTQSQAGAAATAFPGLDDGSTSITSTHFTLKGYSEPDLRILSQTAEDLYSKFGNDTGMYAYLASGSYVLVVYKDRDEYIKKTHQPSWSNAVMAGKAIYCYPSPDLDPILAHMMSHMILDNYLGDKASSLRWLDEGLAMNQELAKMKDTERSAYQTSKSSQLRQNRMPFSQMTFFVTNSEEKRRTDPWYQQVESVLTYLLSQGSALAFAQCVGELRNGVDIDHALSDSYPAKYRSLTELESAWKYTI